MELIRDFWHHRKEEKTSGAPRNPEQNSVNFLPVLSVGLAFWSFTSSYLRNAARHTDAVLFLRTPQISRTYQCHFGIFSRLPYITGCFICCFCLRFFDFPCRVSKQKLGATVPCFSSLSARECPQRFASVPLAPFNFSH